VAVEDTPRLVKRGLIDLVRRIAALENTQRRLADAAVSGCAAGTDGPHDQQHDRNKDKQHHDSAEEAYPARPVHHIGILS